MPSVDWLPKKKYLAKHARTNTFYRRAYAEGVAEIK